MEQVALAEMIARWAHRNQFDKVGVPYIEHPRWIAEHVGQFEGLIVVAWLHDVVEDTEITFQDLLDLGVKPRYVQCVDNLTKRKGERREDAIARAMLDPISHFVKIVDNTHNSIPYRVQLLPHEARLKNAVKYARDREQLFARQRLA
jgi:(p)ppGpp synthase/HD superfamily hydrolase